MSSTGWCQNPQGSGPAIAEETNDLINPDRPGIADGSTVVGQGTFQSEVAYQNEFRSQSQGTERRIFLPMLLRLGLTDDWEARIEGNTYTQTHSVDASKNDSFNSSGVSPISLGVKYHFQDQPAVGGAPSLGTIFRVFPPSGSADFKTVHTTGDLRLAADWDFTSNLSLNPNIGGGLYEDGDGQMFFSGLGALTLNYFDSSRTLNPFIDAGYQEPEEKHGQGSLIVDGGLAVIVGRNIQIDVSAGRGVEGKTPPNPFFAVGVSARFK